MSKPRIVIHNHIGAKDGLVYLWQALAPTSEWKSSAPGTGKGAYSVGKKGGRAVVQFEVELPRGDDALAKQKAEEFCRANGLTNLTRGRLY